MKERKTKTPQQAFTALARLCAKAERSSGDALRLMRGWGVAGADAARVLQRLRDEKFIDDERYAGMYVRDKVRFSGWGPYKIAAGLKSKGIASEIVSRAMASVEERASGGRLYEMLRRKAASLAGDSPYVMKGKLMRFGLSRGFEYAEVTEAVEKIIANED